MDHDGNALVKRRRLLLEREPCAQWILAPAFDERAQELGNLLRAVETLLYRMNSLEREIATRIAESLSSALEGIEVPERVYGDDLSIPPAVKKTNHFIEHLFKTRLAIYDAEKLAQLQARFPDGIPQMLDFGLTLLEKRRLATVKKVITSPHFIPALRACLEASRLNLELHKLSGLSAETLHQLVLDMEAIDADIVPPTYVLSESHRQQLQQMFTNSLHSTSNEAMTPCQDLMPGTFVETSTIDALSQPTTIPDSRTSVSRDVALDARASQQSQRSSTSSHRTSTLHDDSFHAPSPRQDEDQQRAASQSPLTTLSPDDGFDGRAPHHYGTIVSGSFTAVDEPNESNHYNFPPLPGSSSPLGDASSSFSPSKYSTNPSGISTIPYPSDSEDSDGSPLASPVMPFSQSTPRNESHSHPHHTAGNPGVPPSRLSRRESPTPMPVMPSRGRSKTKRLRKVFYVLEQQRLARRDYRQTNQPHYRIAQQYLTDFTGPRVPRDSPIYRSILRTRVRNRVTPRQARSVRFAEGIVSPEPRSRTSCEMLLLRDSSPELSPPSSPPRCPIRYRGHQTASDIDAAKARIDKIFNEPSALLISHVSNFAIQAEKEREAREAEEAALKAAEEARVAEEAARKAAEAQAQRELEQRLQRTHGLRLPEKPLVDSLSDDWLQRAQETLRAGPSTSLATTSEGIELRRHDFAKVVPSTEWLNDEIVNGSLAWLDRAINTAAGIKNTRANTRKCLAMNSFFWKQLTERGPERTQRALRRNHVEKNNFLDVDTILLPVCENLHWTLMVVRPAQRTIAHMDSLNPRGSAVNTNLALAWVKHILEDKFVAEDWHVVRHEAPRQTNGWDCGVHTITNAMCVALGLNPIDCYRAQDMPLQRLRIACVLLNQGFTNDFDLRVY